MAMTNQLQTRSAGTCELCGKAGDLSAHDVGAAGAPSGDEAARQVAVCGTCGPQLRGDVAVTTTGWFGLQESIWSEVAAVQVASFRMLQRLQAEGWARDLLEQCYLDEATAAWAAAGGDGGDENDGVEEAVVVIDTNGTVLSAGDTVTIIKDLNVKGTSMVAKRGTTVKNIRLTDDPEHVEGRVNKVSIYLKTCFLRKL